LRIGESYFSAGAGNKHLIVSYYLLKSSRRELGSGLKLSFGRREVALSKKHHICVAVKTHKDYRANTAGRYQALEYALLKLSVCAVLVYIIIDDLRNYRIRNESIGALIGLFVVETLMRGAYFEAGIQLFIAVVFFLILLIPYSRGLLGGGDVKLLGVAFLWLGDSDRMVFAILFFLLTLLYVVAAKLRLAPSRGKASVFIPFAPSIAGAWLLTIIAGALQL
jgi:prepilin peptidase CpaA